MSDDPTQDDAGISKNTVSEVTLDNLASKIASRRVADERIIVAIAGPPGSGKSTSSDLLQTILNNDHDLTAQIVAMDGYHYDNSILEDLGLLHIKGSLKTFDINGFTEILKRLSFSFQNEDIAIPVFDREIDLSRNSARFIRRETNVLLVEGNYLLMDDERWSSLLQYFDLTVMIDCDEAELRRRLIKRWLDLGYNEEDATKKAESNDLPNASQVLERSLQANYKLISR